MRPGLLPVHFQLVPLGAHCGGAVGLFTNRAHSCALGDEDVHHNPIEIRAETDGVVTERGAYPACERGIPRAVEISRPARADNEPVVRDGAPGVVAQLALHALDDARVHGGTAICRTRLGLTVERVRPPVEKLAPFANAE